MAEATTFDTRLFISTPLGRSRLYVWQILNVAEPQHVAHLPVESHAAHMYVHAHISTLSPVNSDLTVS